MEEVEEEKHSRFGRVAQKSAEGRIGVFEIDR